MNMNKCTETGKRGAPYMYTDASTFKGSVQGNTVFTLLKSVLSLSSPLHLWASSTVFISNLYPDLIHILEHSSHFLSLKPLPPPFCSLLLVVSPSPFVYFGALASKIWGTCRNPALRRMMLRERGENFTTPVRPSFFPKSSMNAFCIVVRDQL